MANSVIVRIDGDDKGFKNTLSGIGNVAKKSLSVAAAGVTATAAGITALTGMAVKGYKEYEQLIGGVDTLFKTSSEQVQAYAANAYKTAGMSQNAYMQTATSFSASLKQSFADTAEGIEAAAETADMAITDMSDNANKMGTDIGRIQDAYQGFAKQNYTMLDNLKLGYGGTKTEMERLLADAEKLSGIKYDIGNLADVFNAIHVIQEELGITGTTAQEAATTIEGSFNMMKASFENLMVGMADENADIDKLLDNFIDSVMTFGDNLLPRIETVFHNIGERIPDFAGILISYLPQLVKELAPEAIETFKEIINQLIDVAPEVLLSLFEAIGDSVPELRPITDLLSELVENFDNLVPVVVACTSAVAAYKVITVTATVAQSALNAAMNLNPYILAASAIIALIGGIATYIATANEASAETKRLNTSLADLEQQTQRNTKTILDNNTATLSEIAVTEQLFNRLIELDTELKNNSEDTEENTQKKSELKGIVDQLNKVSPNFCLAINNETGALANQITTVQNLKTAYIELAKAKAYADAYQQLMTENFKERIELETIADEANDIAIKNSGKEVLDFIDVDNWKIALGITDEEDYVTRADLNASIETARNANSALANNIKKGSRIEENLSNALAAQTTAQTNWDNLTGGNKNGGGSGGGGSSGGSGGSSGNKSTSKKGETPAETELRNLEHAYNMDEINYSDYIRKKTEIRDKYYKEGSKEHQQLSEEINEENKKNLKEQQSISAEARDAELRDLKFQHDMGLSSDKEYYTELARHRDKYFKEGDAEWQQYTLEIENYNKSVTQSIIDDFNETTDKLLADIEEIEQKQTALADRIKGENSLYTEVTYSFYNKDGKLDLQSKEIELTDFSEETKELNAYSDSIEALKERVDLPQTFFSKIRDLSTEEGAKFVNKLLSLSQEDLEAYISEWQENQDAIDKFSKEMYTDETQQLADEIKKIFGDNSIPEGFFQMGGENAESYASGFIDYINNKFDAAKVIQSAFGDISANPSVMGGVEVSGDVIQNITNFNTTVYTDNPTISGELNEAHDATMKNAQRSGYDV